MYRHLRRPVVKGRRRWEKLTFFWLVCPPMTFRVFHLPMSFRVAPADILPIFNFLLTSFWDFRLPTNFSGFRLPTTFNGPPTSLKKIRKKMTSYQDFSIFPPTDDFSRFPPTDDLQRASQRHFKKIAKKIDVFPRFFDFSAYRRLFEISAYRRPSGDH